MKIEWNRVTWYSKLLAVIVFFACIALGFYCGMQYQTIATALNAQSNQTPSASHPQAQAFDPLNATYSIDGQQTTLVNGKAEMAAAPGSATKIVTTVLGKPAYGDLSKDGKTDAALVLTQDAGGTGVFYFVVAAVDTASGTQGTNAISLGDRVGTNTSVTIKNGEILANYGARAPGQAMAEPPTIPVSDTIVLNGSTLSVVASVVGPGEHCGGNMTTAPACATGYHCAPNPGSHLPFGDVGGVCVAN